MTFELLTQDAGKVSFPDCSIKQFEVAGDRLAFISDGIFVEGRGFVRARCQAECSSESPIRSREFVGQVWVDLGAGSSKGLREICEWATDDSDLRIAGFGTSTGAWTEYALSKFTLKILVVAA